MAWCALLLSFAAGCTDGTGPLPDVPARDATAPDDTGPANPCAQIATCDLCTSGSACGWCRNVGRCLAGSATGPSNGACTMAQWAWTIDDCHAVSDAGAMPDAGPPPADSAPPRDAETPVDAAGTCRAAGSCNECTLMATCGWCRTMARCLSGTSTGATDAGACSGTNWAWLSTQCDGG